MRAGAPSSAAAATKRRRRSPSPSTTTTTRRLLPPLLTVALALLTISAAAAAAAASTSASTAGFGGIDASTLRSLGVAEDEIRELMMDDDLYDGGGSEKEGAGEDEEEDVAMGELEDDGVENDAVEEELVDFEEEEGEIEENEDEYELEEEEEEEEEEADDEWWRDPLARFQGDDDGYEEGAEEEEEASLAAEDEVQGEEEEEEEEEGELEQVEDPTDSETAAAVDDEPSNTGAKGFRMPSLGWRGNKGHTQKEEAANDADDTLPASAKAHARGGSVASTTSARRIGRRGALSSPAALALPAFGRLLSESGRSNVGIVLGLGLANYAVHRVRSGKDRSSSLAAQHNAAAGAEGNSDMDRHHDVEGYEEDEDDELNYRASRGWGRPVRRSREEEEDGDDGYEQHFEDNLEREGKERDDFMEHAEDEGGKAERRRGGEEAALGTDDGWSGASRKGGRRSKTLLGRFVPGFGGRRRGAPSDDNDGGHAAADSSVARSAAVPPPSHRGGRGLLGRLGISGDGRFLGGKAAVRDEIQALEERAETAEVERDTIEREYESSSRQLQELQQRMQVLTKTNGYLKAQLRDIQRSSESAVQAERQRANEEMARVRESLVTVLERERRLMRAQMMKTSERVRSLMEEDVDDDEHYSDDDDFGTS